MLSKYTLRRLSALALVTVVAASAALLMGRGVGVPTAGADGPSTPGISTTHPAAVASTSSTGFRGIVSCETSDVQPVVEGP